MKKAIKIFDLTLKQWQIHKYNENKNANFFVVAQIANRNSKCLSS